MFDNIFPSTSTIILLGRDDTTRVNDPGNIPAQRQQQTKPEFDPTPKFPKDAQRGNEVRTNQTAHAGTTIVTIVTGHAARRLLLIY